MQYNLIAFVWQNLQVNKMEAVNFNIPHIPNALTRQAIEDAEKEFKTAKRYKTVEDALKAMQEIADE